MYYRSLWKLDWNSLWHEIGKCQSYCAASRNCWTWASIVSNIHCSPKQCDKGISFYVWGHLQRSTTEHAYYKLRSVSLVMEHSEKKTTNMNIDFCLIRLIMVLLFFSRISIWRNDRIISNTINKRHHTAALLLTYNSIVYLKLVIVQP